jgi:hypothetical protein
MTLSTALAHVLTDLGHSLNAYDFGTFLTKLADDADGELSNLL